MTLHLSEFEGGNALSAFRVQQLLPRLQALVPAVTRLSACYVHWVASDQTLTAAEQQRLQALLYYGDPAQTVPAGSRALVVVAPRLGTVSPWASKATDIAHNCGLAVKRVERVTAYQIGLAYGAVDQLQWAARGRA
ncbi:MAG: hypothetical protein RLZZ401_2372, partial [Pseudomonadota bacterium]